MKKRSIYLRGVSRPFMIRAASFRKIIKLFFFQADKFGFIMDSHYHDAIRPLPPYGVVEIYK